MASIQKRDNKYRVQISKMGIRKNATFRTKLSNIFKLAVERWSYIVKSPMIGIEQPESSKPHLTLAPF